jgi:diguanylate cyclase (GGDEF)-like protein
MGGSQVNATTKTTVAADDLPDGGAESQFRKVLVVDDDPAMRRILSRILESAGYDVAHAANGSEAIDAIQEDLPCFVVTDWDMPVLDGAEFCRMARRQNLPHYIYIVMLTSSDTDRLVEGLSAGADDFITKPVKPQELLARLKAGTRVLVLEDQLRLLATRDPLTNLLNRRRFFEILQRQRSQSRRIGYPLSCAMIDLDFFKKINDAYGHLAGDTVLRLASRALQESCRETDFVCRYGGEEFSVLLPDTDEQVAVAWAERCRSAIAETPFVVEGVSVQITASFGVAQWHHDTDTPEKFLDLADQALLAAKRSGRNRVVAFGSLQHQALV